MKDKYTNAKKKNNTKVYEIWLKHLDVIAAEHKNKRQIHTQVQSNKQTQKLIEELWNPGQALRC